MQIISDLQIHSKYSRAVSKNMSIFEISKWAKIKGINLVATGDWTHPLWIRELESNLVEAEEGVYKLKDEKGDFPLFLLSSEISSIYTQGGKLRKVHTLIFAPNFSTVEKINKALVAHGANLSSDGRPIVGLSAKTVAEIVLEIDEQCILIPAHAWTPHFSIFGSNSGFDSIEECFDNLASKIYAIETGLSSDPAMNWRIKDIDKRSIVSFSDAHSPAKLGREATVFQTKTGKNMRVNYKELADAIRNEPDSNLEIAYTIEFYPEEGKYHYSGHRNCNVKYSPQDNIGTICPVCGRRLTIGVMQRVEELAARSLKDLKIAKKKIENMRLEGFYSESFDKRPPYVLLVPLVEILAESLDSVVSSKKVEFEYKKLTENLGSEFDVLLRTTFEEIERISGARIAEGIKRVREGNLFIDPGFDGVFGKVKIWGEEDQKKTEKFGQERLF